MVACWESDPTSRPDFASLFEYLSNLHDHHYYPICNNFTDNSDSDSNQDNAEDVPVVTEVGEYLELVDND